ncbi:RIP metalloprotease RseP [Roseivirga seohaensis]|uniref:Zinc metalloprotease n=1 Tax=Roseivirga seohaensis TaxID=1914963 RepID=A0A150Y0I5_9BACT|nr:RIP metalloprotease RseP [Roseivirga seohaensis]KYG84355.1 RIP metalloprotease RseP [Roseivirga seohaensis]
METIVQIAQLLLALSILVGIHEAGHMLAARFFGMKVEKFFIGFPPKVFSFKKGDTEYGLGAIPLGGFVKISGMIDESMDKEQMKQEPQPWEFRSKPAWQRLIVMLGGIIVNVIAGIIAFVILTYNQGEAYIPAKFSKEYGVVAGEIAQEVGFQTGDKVIMVNGADYDRFGDITSGETLLTTDGYWTVERNGQQLDIPIPKGFLNNLSDEEFQSKFLEPRRPVVVADLQEGFDIPLQEGDKILKANGVEVQYFDQLRSEMANYAGQNVAFLIERNGQEVTVNLDVNQDTQIGIALAPAYEISEYTLAEAIPRGTSKAFGAVILNAKAMGKMFKFNGEMSARNMSGPIGIVNMFPKTWDWNAFWGITGFISMVLAFMNLLPIPALDGGHVMFLLFEMVSGKAPSDQFLENAQKVGMVILLLLMVFVFGNDILKLFGI